MKIALIPSLFLWWRVTVVEQPMGVYAEDPLPSPPALYDYPADGLRGHLNNSLRAKCQSQHFSYFNDEYELKEWDQNYRIDFRHKDKIAVGCSKSTDNPRGSYTSHLTSCIFKFHNNTKEENLSHFEVSTVCSDSNALAVGKNKNDTVADYVVQWPDECVGDFQRCYSVVRNERLILRPCASESGSFQMGLLISVSIARQTRS